MRQNCPEIMKKKALKYKFETKLYTKKVVQTLSRGLSETRSIQNFVAAGIIDVRHSMGPFTFWKAKTM